MNDINKETKIDKNYFRILIQQNNETNDNEYFNYDYYLINQKETTKYKLKIFVEKRKKEDKILYHISLNHLTELQNQSNRKYINLDKIFKNKIDNYYYFEKNERQKRTYERNTTKFNFDDDAEIIELQKKIAERIKFLRIEQITKEIERLTSLKSEIK